MDGLITPEQPCLQTHSHGSTLTGSNCWQVSAELELVPWSRLAPSGAGQIAIYRGAELHRGARKRFHGMYDLPALSIKFEA